MPFFPVLLTGQSSPLTSQCPISIYTVEGKGGLVGSTCSRVLFCVVDDSSWKLLPVVSGFFVFVSMSFCLFVSRMIQVLIRQDANVIPKIHIYRSLQ